MRKWPLAIGVIGAGAIGSDVIDAILNATHGLRADRVRLVGVLVKNERNDSPWKDACVVTHQFEEFFAESFDVIVEAAGQAVMRDYGERILKRGINLLCTSMGALTDDTLRTKLEQAAVNGNSQLLLASGAMPALDWMHSSSSNDSTDGAATTNGPASRVLATQRKPPESWKGARFEPGTSTPMDDVIDFDTVADDAPVVFFEGSAREAAMYYPKNSNILAMLAMATAGLDKTCVQLVADRKAISLHVEYEGSAGKIDVDVVGKKSRTNPRTSQVVPLSVIKTLKNLSNPVVYGV